MMQTTSITISIITQAQQDDQQQDINSAIVLLDGNRSDDDSGRGWHPLSQLRLAPRGISQR